ALPGAGHDRRAPGAERRLRARAAEVADRARDVTWRSESMLRKRTHQVIAAAAASVALAGIAAASGVHAAAAPPASGVVAQMTIAGINNGTPTTIQSFSLGATDALGTADGGTGKVSFAGLAISKVLDADSVPLLQAAATGQRLSRVTIELFNGTNTTP